MLEGDRLSCSNGQEVKTKHGTVERTYTQCEQTWPLGIGVKLESIESATLILRQACDYLYNGMTQLSSITGGKCDTERVQQVIADLMTQLQRLQATISESSQGVASVTSRVDELSGDAKNARSRLEGLERRVGMEGQQDELVLRELRASLDRCVADVNVLCQNSTEYQMDIQARASELFEMKDLIFKLSVELDECREGIRKVQDLPESGSASVSDQQEQMKAFQNSLDETRKQLEIQDKKLQDGERQMRRLQDEVAAARVRPKPEVQEGLPIDVQAALETRFTQIEEMLQKSQQQYSQWQGDSVKDFQSVEAYLTQVHAMVTEMHHRTEAASSSMPDRPRVTKLSVAARKGDTRVEVDSPEACRVGEVVLLGE